MSKDYLSSVIALITNNVTGLHPNNYQVMPRKDINLNCLTVGLLSNIKPLLSKPVTYQ